MKNFIINDKCAAGTGRFLEIIADALKVPLFAFEWAGKKARQPDA